MFKKRVFFRDDDVGRLDRPFIRLLDIFLEEGLPLHLSVIPRKLSLRCRVFLKKRMEQFPGSIEIGQHGFEHRDYSGGQPSLKKHEFGHSRSGRQQARDIADGRKILEEAFGRPVDIFTPPWHCFDRRTMAALVREKFSVLCVDYKKHLLMPKTGLKIAVVHIHLPRQADSGAWFMDTNDNLLRDLAGIHQRQVGILLHHKAFKEKRAFAQLRILLRLLKKDPGVELVALSKAAQSGVKAGRINHQALAYYLTYQFVPKPHSLLKGTENSVERRFDFSGYLTPKIATEGSEKIKAKQVAETLKEAVEALLPSGREPVGLLLSGGMDSAILLDCMREVTDRKICTVTGAYASDAEHLSLAEKLSRRYGTIHHRVIFRPKDLRLLDKIYDYRLLEPIGDNGFLPTYLMMESLKARTKTVFSGDGSDCLFAGLQMHKEHLACVQKRGKDGQAAFFEHYAPGEIFLSEKELKNVLPGHGRRIRLSRPLRDIARHIKIKDPVKRQVVLDLNFLVKNRVDYLLWAARINGMDICLPYLTRRFVAVSLRIPSGLLIKDGRIQKYILRRAFDGRLPPEVLSRRREGLTPPFTFWYLANRGYVIKKIIRSCRLGVAPSYAKSLIMRMKECRRYDVGMRIWLLLNLVSWYERTGLSSGGQPGLQKRVRR